MGNTRVRRGLDQARAFGEGLSVGAWPECFPSSTEWPWFIIFLPQRVKTALRTFIIDIDASFSQELTLQPTHGSHFDSEAMLLCIMGKTIAILVRAAKKKNNTILLHPVQFPIKESVSTRLHKLENRSQQIWTNFILIFHLFHTLIISILFWCNCPKGFPPFPYLETTEKEWVTRFHWITFDPITAENQSHLIYLGVQF